MRNAMPWDLLNPNIKYVDEETYDNRYSICQNCEHFINLTKQCSKCFCFMNVKCAMDHAFCPEKKWGNFPETLEIID